MVTNDIHEYRLPRPYPVRAIWPLGKDIAKLPSVGVLGGRSGPMRSYLAQAVEEAPFMSGIIETLIGPSRKWKIDALKNLPFLGQRAGGGRYLKNFPVACAIRNRLNKILSR